MEPHFLLSKSKVLEQLNILKNLGLEVSYSYKTNSEVGNLLQNEEVEFSIHTIEELNKIQNKSKISFFLQAEKKEEIKNLLEKGVRSFVVDNEIDLSTLLKTIDKSKTKINLSLRMKFAEHRIGTGRYFVYGMPSKKINELILKIRKNPLLSEIGIHLHRKSQNVSEWEIQSEIEDSLTEETLKKIDFINLGGGLPSEYRSFSKKILPYIFEKIKETRKFLENKGIKTIIEPGRFIAAPAIKLKTQVIQIQERNLIINTTIYNCALDTILTGTKMLVEEELNENEDGEYYLIKGNSPTRDDIFRYKVKLKNPKVGNTITFLNAGAYNYTTDFFGYKKLETKIVENF